MISQQQTLMILGCVVFVAVWFLWFLYERSCKIAKIHDLVNELDIDYYAEMYKWFFVERHARLRKEYLLKVRRYFYFKR